MENSKGAVGWAVVQHLEPAQMALGETEGWAGTIAEEGLSHPGEGDSAPVAAAASKVCQSAMSAARAEQPRKGRCRERPVGLEDDPASRAARLPSSSFQTHRRSGGGQMDPWCVEMSVVSDGWWVVIVC